MKTIFSLLAVSFLLFPQFLCAQYENEQNPTLPQSLKDKFDATNAGASDVEWEWEDDHFEVEFLNANSIREEIWYDNSDNVIRDKTEITKKDLPQAVLDAITQNYAEYKLDEIEKIIIKGKEVQYKVELESFTQEWRIWFSETGSELDKEND